MTIEPRSSARATPPTHTLERSRVELWEGWTHRPSRASVALVPRKPDDLPPLTPLEHLRLEPLASQSASAKLVWMYVLERGAARISIRDLAGALGLTPATVHGAIRALEAVELLESEPGSGTAATFYRAKKPRTS